ncbi:MAG: beta-ketodecanoyl-[acyl-carrier-protein] synthase [Phenylobacterium sp.]|jgi:beta-ketodecanoyl-[acyl-carrier-protein] synthase
MKSIVISGSGLFTPEHTISNEELVNAYNQYVDLFNQQNQQAIAAEELAALPYSSSAFIEKASGIKSRHVMYKDTILDPHIMMPQIDKCGPDDTPEMVTMALAAAKEALAQAGRHAHEVDLIICAASNSQRPYPALAIELQHLLGAQGYAYDMNVACSSATFAIINASNAIQTGNAKVALVVNPEFASPQLNYKSRDSHFIFGDVCTATIIEAEQDCNPGNAFRILGTKQKTQFSNNIRCAVNYTDHCAGNIPDDNPYFTQEGRKVFKELLPIVAKLILSHLEEMHLSATDLKRLWLHQANINMNVFAAKKILAKEEVDELEAPLVLDEYGNTASAGSIIAFHLYKADFTPGDKGILCSFGAGYSVGCIGLEKL